MGDNNLRWFRDAFGPRHGGGEFDLEDAAYVRSVVLVGVPYALLGAAVALFCLLSACCTVAGKRREAGFCSRWPVRGTRAERGSTAFVLALALSSLVMMSAAGETANVLVTVALVDDEVGGPLDGGNATTVSAETFVQVYAGDMLERIGEILVPLNGVRQAFRQTARNVDTQLRSVDESALGARDRMRAALDDFDAEYSALTVVGAEGYPYLCIACAAFLPDAAATARVELDDQIGATLDEIARFRRVARSELIDAEDDIGEKLVDFAEQLQQAERSLVRANSSTEAVAKVLRDINTPREGATHALFALLVAVALFTLSALLSEGAVRRFRCGAWTLLGVATLSLLAAALYMPVARMVADTCDYVDEYEATMRSDAARPGDELRQQQARMALACVERENLVAALGYADALDFADLVALGAVSNASEALADLLEPTYTEENRTRESWGNETYLTYGFDQSARIEQPWREYAAAHSAELGGVETAEQFVAHSPPIDGDMVALQAYVAQSLETRTRLIDANSRMFADAEALRALFELEVEGVTRASMAAADADRTLRPLTDLVADLTAVSTCDEAGAAYRAAQRLICGRLLQMTSLLAMSTVFAALFALVGVCAARRNVRTWPRKEAAPAYPATDRSCEVRMTATRAPSPAAV